MVAAQIVISVDEKGQLSVTGPITNKGLCYSLIECAKDVIRTESEKAASQIAGVPAIPDISRDRTLSFERRS